MDSKSVVSFQRQLLWLVDQQPPNTGLFSFLALRSITMPSLKKNAQAKERAHSSSSDLLTKNLKRKHDPEPKAQNISKKSKPSLKPPTSISRPRKPESTSAKKSSKSRTSEPESESDQEEDAEPASEQEDSEDDGHLHGFSTDDDDSSDEDALDDEPSEFDLGKLPTIAKDDATVKRKLEKAKQQQVSFSTFSALFCPNSLMF